MSNAISEKGKIISGSQGPRGRDGLGIKSVDINQASHLIVTYDDNTTHDAGLISGGSGGQSRTDYWERNLIDPERFPQSEYIIPFHIETEQDKETGYPTGTLCFYNDDGISVGSTNRFSYPLLQILCYGDDGINCIKGKKVKISGVFDGNFYFGDAIAESCDQGQLVYFYNEVGKWSAIYKFEQSWNLETDIGQSANYVGDIIYGVGWALKNNVSENDVYIFSDPNNKDVLYAVKANQNFTAGTILTSEILENGWTPYSKWRQVTSHSNVYSGGQNYGSPTSWLQLTIYQGDWYFGYQEKWSTIIAAPDSLCGCTEIEIPASLDNGGINMIELSACVAVPFGEPFDISFNPKIYLEKFDLSTVDQREFNNLMKLLRDPALDLKLKDISSKLKSGIKVISYDYDNNRYPCLADYIGQTVFNNSIDTINCYDLISDTLKESAEIAQVNTWYGIGNYGAVYEKHSDWYSETNDTEWVSGKDYYLRSVIRGGEIAKIVYIEEDGMPMKDYAFTTINSDEGAVDGRDVTNVGITRDGQVITDGHPLSYFYDIPTSNPYSNSIRIYMGEEQDQMVRVNSWRGDLNPANEGLYERTSNEWKTYHLSSDTYQHKEKTYYEREEHDGDYWYNTINRCISEANPSELGWYEGDFMYQLTSDVTSQSGKIYYWKASDKFIPRHIYEYQWYEGDQFANVPVEGASFTVENYWHEIKLSSNGDNRLDDGTSFVEMVRNIGIRLLDEPSGVSIEYVDGLELSVNIKWTDPSDINTYEPVPATWAGTVVVRKEGSAPKNVWDGTIVVDSTTKNAYSSTALTDNNVDFDTTYYYGIFPYHVAVNDANHPIKHYRFTKVVSITTPMAK